MLPYMWEVGQDDSGDIVTHAYWLDVTAGGGAIDSLEPPSSGVFRLVYLFSVLHLSWRGTRRLLRLRKGGAAERADAPDEARH
jgi:hypothetical protein